MHEDHDPSLVLTPSRGLWHCLGACQAGGTVIDWVMKADGLDFREAVDKLLAEFFPLEAASLVRRAAVTEQACPLDLDADDQALLNQYADFCHELFRTTAEPKEYVAKRGISSDELVSHFKLGYANRTLGLRLPNVKSKAGLTLRTRLQDLGILRASGHEHLVGSLVIAIRDSAGNVTGMYGRKTRNDLRTGTPDHLYLPGPHRGVFNVEAFEEKTIILTESLIDALSFWGSGLQERHVRLRRRGLHRRDPRGLLLPRDREVLHRLRPRRGRRSRRRGASPRSSWPPASSASASSFRKAWTRTTSSGR